MKIKKSVNVRQAAIMEQVREQVRCYHSELVESIRAAGNEFILPGLHIRLASAFGFCDGVHRAIEIAYATCRMFEGRRIWLIGEIIHNPEVNARLDALGLRHLPWSMDGSEYDDLSPEDVVIIPAFGVSVEMRRKLEDTGAQLVDCTCGNVIKVWQRVRSYARSGITSIIHGKVRHEESMATASQSRGDDRCGHFLVLFSEEDAAMLADYISGRGDRARFSEHFAGCCSMGFDPDVHLQTIGMANQTTMLKEESLHIQQMLRRAVVERDGDDSRFHAFDTICGATQDRQQALLSLLDHEPDTMFIIGGYNSSNTTHLAHISSLRVPTFFVRDASCLHSLAAVSAYQPDLRCETEAPLPPAAADLSRVWRVGITAGASCPANIVEGVIRRLAQLRGISQDC